LSSESKTLRTKFSRKHTARSSSSVSVRMLVMLEQFAADPNSPSIPAALAGAFVALALGCVRFCQAQRSCAGATIALGFLAGIRECVTLKEKHPVLTEQTPASWYLPAKGIASGFSWSRAWRKSVEPVEKSYFMFRDFDCETGDPFGATNWLPGPLSRDKATLALRFILRRATGMSEEVAATFGTSSFRHFLPNVGKASMQPMELRRELGRWAGSIARDIDPLDPLVSHIVEPARTGMAALPDRYAFDSKPATVTAILLQVVDICATLVKSDEWIKVPLLGGWEFFLPAHLRRNAPELSDYEASDDEQDS
jgi:hypothetical protein